MRRLPQFSIALALCCAATAPAFAQGDGAYQQAEREQASQCQGRLGAGPDQGFRIGSTLPKYLRGNPYVVNDWRAHNLSGPSWRSQWIQVGADYVLVETLTHRIRAVRLNGC